MKRPTNLKKGDQFRVIGEDNDFKAREIISLLRDDGTNSPFFWKEDRSDYYYINFPNIEPLIKTIRDAQVGDVVTNNDIEYRVLERWQNTVLLSYDNNSKKTLSNIYTFDQLEEYFTLKAE